MSETDTTTETTTDTAAEVEKWKALSRKHEAAAKANAKAAEELAELKASQQTEQERLAAAAATATEEASKARAEALRWKTAAKHGISDEDADLFLTGQDEDTLEKQATRLKGRDAGQRQNSNIVPKEGATTPAPAASDEKAFVKNLFGGGEST